MRKDLGLPFGLAAAAAVFAAFAFSGLAQTQSPTKPQIVSFSHAIHAVGDLDATLAFYRDVFDLKGMPQDFPNPGVPLLTDAPGVTLRLSMMRLPGSMQFELTDFRGPERKPVRANYWDPGAGSLVLYVHDIDAVVANAKKANATIVTTGGKPVEIATSYGEGRSILLRDPDGFFVQVTEERPASGSVGPAPSRYVGSVSLAYTMQSAEATEKFYNGAVGLSLTGSPAFSKDASFLKLVGAPPGTEFRKLTGTFPGAAKAYVEFTEFRGVPRIKFEMRVRDPGAPAFAIQVNTLSGMLEAMKADGAKVISANGQIVDFGGGTNTIFVEDPNGLHIETFERNPAQGKGKGKAK